MRRILKKSNVVAIASLCVAATLLSSVAQSADPIKRGNLGTGLVVGVNKPGDANFKGLKPNFGDKLETTTYAPNDDSNRDLGLVNGSKYTMLMITGKDNQQAFVYWETPDPEFQDLLLKKSSEVDSLGNRGFDLQRGDKATIQAQRDGDKVNVTFSFFRDREATGTVSFNLAGKDSGSPFPKGYFYMTPKFFGDEWALESDPLALRKRGKFTGMAWKAMPAGDGYYFLTTKHLEEKKLVLEGGDGQGGSSVMVSNERYTGTMWKVIRKDNGYFTLTNKCLEEHKKVLDCQNDTAPRMVTGEGDTTKWKFTPVDLDE